MKCKFLFESDVFDENIGNIVDEVRRQGMEANIVHYVPLKSGETYLDIYDKDDCVFFYGSLGFAAQIAREASWVPGTIFNQRNYFCQSYYPYFGPYLLATSYAMLPYGDFERCEEKLYRNFGLDRAIFVRPNSGNKTFTGQLIYRENFPKDSKYIGYYGLKPDDLIVVSEPRNIVAEWRFVIADRKIIAASLYNEGGEVRRQRGAPLPAYRLAHKIAQIDWQPDRAYTADICKTKLGNYYLLEIGTVSCSGYYDCNPKYIVREISRIALEEWENVHP